jgi:hypothetical protein
MAAAAAAGGFSGLGAGAVREGREGVDAVREGPPEPGEEERPPWVERRCPDGPSRAATAFTVGAWSRGAGASSRWPPVRSITVNTSTAAAATSGWSGTATSMTDALVSDLCR